MACLTRGIQQQLSRYLQKNLNNTESPNPEKVRDRLVQQGLCSSDITTDQVALILEDIQKN